jgi:organic hydroperoxide reductase OsmC/OhrA
MTKPITTSATSATPAACTEAPSGFSLAIHLYSDYQQIVDFRMPGVAVLGLDECPPVGRGWGPSPSHLLAASLGACLGGALLQELRDAGAEVLDLFTNVSGAIRKDIMGRSHVASINVRLTPVVTARSALEAMPSPERLAQKSMIADALRTDLGLWIAITPEVRTTARATSHTAVRVPKRTTEVSAPVPRFIEAVAQ